MRVVNTDATPYQYKSPEKCLETTDKAKKKKYLDTCLKQLRYFTPFVVSVGGLFRVEAEATLKRIDTRLMMKWKEPYSRICGYKKSRVAINLVLVAHRCTRGAKVSDSQISMQCSQWEDGAGLHLFR